MVIVQLVCHNLRHMFNCLVNLCHWNVSNQTVVKHLGPAARYVHRGNVELEPTSDAARYLTTHSSAD